MLELKKYSFSQTTQSGNELDVNTNIIKAEQISKMTLINRAKRI